MFCGSVVNGLVCWIRLSVIVLVVYAICEFVASTTLFDQFLLSHFLCPQCFRARLSFLIEPLRDLPKALVLHAF